MSGSPRRSAEAMAQSYVEACALPLAGSGLESHDTAVGAVLLALLRRVKRLVGDGDSHEAAILAGIEARLTDGNMGGLYRAWSPVVAVLRQKIAAGDARGAIAQLALIQCDLLGGGIAITIELDFDGDLYHRGCTLRFPAGTRLDFRRYDPSSPAPGVQLAALASGLPAGPLERLRRESEAAELRRIDWSLGDSKFAVPTLEVSNDLIDVEVVWPPALEHGVSAETLDGACRYLALAHRTIASVSPDYAVWVARLIRGFAITNMPDDATIDSGSFFTRPGLVHCAFPLNRDLVVETLIHEASHQHFILLNSMLPMVEKGPQELIYSPIKGMERPLSRVLFAFHACVNIHRFFAAVDPAAASEFDLERRDLMHDYASAMSAKLAQSAQLTAAGRELVALLDKAL